jgi:hypothetical protein
MLGQTMRTSAKTVLVILLLALFVWYFGRRFPEMQKGTDFADFYAAARMVRDGRGGQLYNATEQDKYLARYSGRVGTYFIHPPFEPLIYLPFALLPLSDAYLLWCAFNALLLVLVAWMLAQYVPLPWKWWTLVPLSLLFVPLLLNFLQGQDALLLLFLWTAAFVALGQKRTFVAGCLLACGLIKFHLALPTTIPFLFAAPRKVFRGFVTGATVLLLFSVRVCGWAGTVSYPRFLAQLSSFPLAGVRSQQMANLRGLFATIFPHSRNLALGLTVFGSILLVGLVIHGSALAVHTNGQTKLVFANAVLAAIMVGYHASPHDLVLLLLPFALIAHHLLTAKAVPGHAKLLLLVTSGLLFLPPLYLWLLQAQAYAYACIPVLLLFVLTYGEVRRAAAFDLRAHPDCRTQS